MAVGAAEALTKGFPEPKVPLTSNEGEVVVGVHHSGLELEEGLNTNNSRYYCTNCRKKIHCYVTVDRDTNEAIFHNNCKDKECECRCKTHFACKQCGYLHPYGEKCDRVQDEKPKYSKESEKEFEKIMSGWTKSHKEEAKVQKKK